MKYLFTFVLDNATGGNFADGEGNAREPSPEELGEVLERWTAFDREAIEAGVMIANNALQDSSTATTIEIKENGERVTTDGPFAESKEQVGGFCLLECKDLDEALEWAKRCPIREGAVEVRPVFDYSEHGDEGPAEAGATPASKS